MKDNEAKKEKKRALRILLFSAGIYLVLMGLHFGFKIREEQKKPLVLTGFLEEGADIESGCKIKGIADITELKQADVTFSVDGYSGEATVYGLNSCFLERRYGEYIDAEFSDNMPYLLVEEDVFYQLKGEGGGRLKVTDDSDYVLKSVKLTASEKEYQGRICGVIPSREKSFDETEEEEQEEETDDYSPGYVYTNMKGFELFTKSDASDEMERACMIMTKSGRGLNDLSEELEGYRIRVELEESLKEQVNQWELLAMQQKSRMAIGIILLVFACSLNREETESGIKKWGRLIFYGSIYGMIAFVLTGLLG